MKNYIELPEDYIELFTIDLQQNKKLAFIVNGLSLFIMLGLIVIGHFIIPIFQFYDTLTLIHVLVLVIGMIMYILLHEMIHGIFMYVFSKQKPFFGYSSLYAYAGSSCYFNKKHYLIIALAPIVILGIILLIFNLVIPNDWFWVIYFLQIMNIGGSSGDLYVTYRFSKLPKDILIKDIGVNMSVYTKRKIC